MNNKVFEKLSLTGITTLLDIVQSSQMRESSHLKRIFSEQSEGFEETVAFATETGMVKEINGIIKSNVDWNPSAKGQIKTMVLDHILKNENRYRKGIINFIKKFHIIDDDVVYSPSDKNRSSETAVRNFLIEMSVINHVFETSKYLLDSNHLKLFIDAKDQAKYMSPAMLASKLAQQKSIGSAAEYEIFLYEQKRVGELFADEVEHVSLKNEAAGYDIRSVTIKNDDLKVYRFIEVKAVSSQDYRFYWSQNEMDVARDFGNWYYLYLLPSDGHHKFNFSGLKIIADPHKSLMMEEGDWICKYVCHLKSTSLK